MAVKDIKVSYRPQGPVIADFHRSKAWVRIIIGPLGSSKTTACIIEILRWMQSIPADGQGIRHSRFAIIRNTYPDLETTTIPDWRAVVDDSLGRFTNSAPPMHKLDFKLPDGTSVKSEIFFLALDKPDDVKKLRGMQLTGGWVNETKEVPKEIFDMLTARVGRYPRRQSIAEYRDGVIGDTNAPDDDHWIAKFEQYETPDDWEFFKQPGGVFKQNGAWVENPRAENVINLPPEYYKRLMSGKTNDWISVNLANEYGTVKSGKPVHPDFEPEMHMARAPLVWIPRMTVYVGIDFGRTPAAAFGQKVPYSDQPNEYQWRILREFVTFNMSVFKFSELLYRFMSQEFQDAIFEVWGDPSGADMAQTRDETAFDMLAANNIAAQPCYTNDPDIRIGTLDRLLMQFRQGQPAIVFDPQVRYIKAGLMGGYKFKRLQVSEERYHDKPMKNEHSHVVEALHYMLVGAGEDAPVVVGPRMANDELKMRENWHPRLNF